MAVRGINPIEKHIEKVFLGLAAAGLTGVVAWQFAGGSGTVDIGTERGVPAEQAYSKLETKAKSLQDKMREASPKTPDALRNQVDPLLAFKNQLAGAVSPKPAFDYTPVGLAFGPAGTDKPVADQFFLPPVLPPSARPIAHPFMSTVHAGDVTSYEGLAKYLPAQAPFDKASVSVETTIDPKAIRDVLERDPDGEGPAQPLLRAWWAGTEVVAVELVRQEQQPDGTWGNEIAAPVLPGRRNYVQQLSDPAIDSQTLAGIATDAGVNIEEIMRPQWYRRAELAGGVVGDAWQQPSEAAKADAAPGDDPLAGQKKSLRELRQRLQQTERALEAQRQTPAVNPGGGGGGPRPSGRGPIGPGSGGGGAGGQPRPDAREEQIKRLEKQVETLKGQIADLEKRIADAGGKADTAPPAPVTRDSDLGLLLSSQQPVTIWSHDVDAKRGATYRYQLRAKLNNPLFNRGGQLRAENADVAKSPTITLPAGEWSDPVRVDDEVYCFITGAGPGNNQASSSGLGTAQAKLYYYTWGYWRDATISLEPGDGMTARWAVPDETKIAAGVSPAGAPDAPPLPREAPGGARRPAIAPGGGAPVPNNPPPAAAAAAVEKSLPTRDLVKERDAFLLDVVQNPLSKAGSQKVSFLALIREADKTIVARDPDNEKKSNLFLALEASARAGRDQLRGVIAGPAGDNPPGNPVPPAPMNPIPPGVTPGPGGLGGG